MWLFNVRNSAQSESGYTLIEMVVVVLLIGIMSAIATPSILASLESNKLDNSLTAIRGALEEAQREAMRKGNSCSVVINPTNKNITGSCLITGTRNIDSGVSVLPTTSSTVTYTFKGNTTSSATVVLSSVSSPNGPSKRCLTVSEGVGILRTGIYQGSTSSIDENNCQAAN